jgi:signal transduction histidine kinase
MHLDPDEQIELFRIVQEGWRTSGGTHTHDVPRYASRNAEGAASWIVDDGEGFRRGRGQDLRNIRARIASIEAALSLRTSPGAGTALEVTLRG